jgi:hypothetical protein
MLGARGWRAGRGRETDGVSAATWPDQGGLGTLLPKVCSALLPALMLALITFRRLEPNGHKGPQVTAVSCLAASDHSCGQDIPAIGICHQHSPAKALFAGFRTRNELPPPRRCFVTFESGGNHFVCAGLTPPALLRYFARVHCPRDYSTACCSTVR